MRRNERAVREIREVKKRIGRRMEAMMGQCESRGKGRGERTCEEERHEDGNADPDGGHAEDKKRGGEDKAAARRGG